MELGLAFGAIGLPLAYEWIGLDACGVLQIHLHAIDGIWGDDVNVLGGLAAVVQARLRIGIAAH